MTKASVGHLPDKSVPITVYIIAFNEIDKIRASIESVHWASDVLVVDSHSTDGTTELALSLGARVAHVKFEGYGSLRNSALKLCKHEWVFSLDADERCTADAALEIARIVSQDGLGHDFFFVPRRNFFLGRWIRHSGWYPNYRQPQLFRKGSIAYDSLPVHEGFIALSSRLPGYMTNAIWQFPFKNVSELTRKAEKYSDLGSFKLLNKNVSVWSAFGHGCWSFIKHYVFKLGFLDGGAGLVIAAANFQGTFYRYLKAYERQLHKQGSTTRD